MLDGNDAWSVTKWFSSTEIADISLLSDARPPPPRCSDTLVSNGGVGRDRADEQGQTRSQFQLPLSRRSMTIFSGQNQNLNSFYDTIALKIN